MAGLNFASCAGQILFLPVPIEIIADDLPKAYQPRRITPATTNLIVHADQCDEVRVDGRYLGAAQVVSIFVTVTVNGAAPSQGGEIPVYLLEMLSNRTELVDWFARRSPNAGVATTTLASEDAPPDYVAMKGRTAQDQKTFYEWMGTATKAKSTIAERLRFYLGPDPAKDSFSTIQTYEQSMSDGPVHLTLAPDSRVSKILGGSPTGEGIHSIRNLRTSNWQLPAT